MLLSLSWVVTVFLNLLCVSASSTAPRPLKRIAHPSTLAIDILPRQPNFHGRRSFDLDSTAIRHSDSFRLTLAAFGETYHIHLRPNEHLVHPATRIHYYSTTPFGQTILTHTEPLLRESVKAYWGEVVPGHLTAAKMRQDAAGMIPNLKDSLGWARIMIHTQGDPSSGRPPVFEGAFTVNGVTHHISTTDNYLRNKHSMDPHIFISSDHPDSSLVIWRDSDTLSIQEEATIRIGQGLKPIVSRAVHPATCAHDSMNYNTDSIENPVLRQPTPSSTWYDLFGFMDPYPVGPNETLSKRSDISGGNGMSSNFINNIGSGAGCPITQKVVYMGVAADCTFSQRYGGQQQAIQQILTDWNSATSLYKSTFNVSLGILEVQVFNGTCPSNADPATPWNVACGSVTLNDRLSLFSQWRGNKGQDGTGLWHLLTQCTTGSEVGIAWLATLCQTTASGSSPNVVSGTAVSTAGRTEWQVVAHEIGHNFGAIHDCVSGCTLNDPCCPLNSQSCDTSSVFIMSPTAADTESRFSECSLGNICSLMLGNSGTQTNTSCVLDPDPSRHIISLQMCGNGIVEAGEDCDPGPNSNTTCCNPTTCKFTQNSVCDPTNSPCCTNSCKFAPSTQVCRPSKNAICDIAEYCTSTSASCPSDVTAPNGKSCGSNGLACASGTCTSLDLQCQTNGASMNLTKACPSKNDKSCVVSCLDPTTVNQCVVLQAQLVDGSPCGYAGTCYSGACKAGSWQNVFKAWYRANLQIAIPVTVLGGVLVLLLLWVLFVAIRRRLTSPRKKSVEPALANTPASRLPSWETPVSINARGHSAPAPMYNTRPPRSRSRSRAIVSPPPSTHSHKTPSNYSRPHRSSGSHGGSHPSGDIHTGANSRDGWIDDSIYNGYRR